jgi:tRNA-Thr(GGU) m(6)t(6)A37 methyltransferase TsaA
LHGNLRYFCGMKTIARIHTDFPTKFGIPRQSGIIPSLQGKIVFEPEYRNAEAVRGLEEFSHIWLLWEFSEAVRDNWSPTVRPPRLGGNVRKGVFATRSPFRPNPIGLSSVRLEKVDIDPQFGPVLYVSGADLMDGTPIYDIKPYIAYTDSHPDAVSGFASTPAEYLLDVDFPETLLQQVPEKQRESLIEVLAHDPRPQYQDDPERVYGMEFGEMEVKFKVKGMLLSVVSIA